jgi:hypothetical protein
VAAAYSAVTAVVTTLRYNITTCARVTSVTGKDRAAHAAQ